MYVAGMDEGEKEVWSFSHELPSQKTGRELHYHGIIIKYTLFKLIANVCMYVCISLKTNKEHMQQFQTDRLQSELRLNYTHANTDVLTTPQTLKRTPPVPDQK